MSRFIRPEWTRLSAAPTHVAEGCGVRRIPPRILTTSTRPLHYPTRPGHLAASRSAGSWINCPPEVFHLGETKKKHFDLGKVVVVDSSLLLFNPHHPTLAPPTYTHTHSGSDIHISMPRSQASCPRPTSWKRTARGMLGLPNFP